MASAHADRATIVASLTEAPGADGEEIRALAGRADVLEVRADLLGELDPQWLRERFPGRLLYTLRSVAEGGRFEGVRRRATLLGAAARAFDLVDLELERDLIPDLAALVAPEQRIISWHGVAEDLPELDAVAQRMLETPHLLVKLVPTAVRSGLDLLPLQLLRQLGRNDVAAFAGGSIGFWTRLLAPRLGAPWIFAAAGAVPAAPGQLSLARLERDWRLPSLRPIERLAGVVGDDALSSLSPRLHDGALRELDLPVLYVPFQVEHFSDFWMDVVDSGALDALGFPLAALAVTAPWKSVALAVAGAGSPLAERVGAANTLTRRGRVWEAETTDGEGLIAALEHERVHLAGARTLVVGAGGAGRSAAFALVRAGAAVTIANRSDDRGRSLARDLGADFLPWEELDPHGFSLIIQATSRGREGDPVLDAAAFDEGTTVLDLVYRLDGPTPLIAAARARGLLGIDGREVLLEQAKGQFRLAHGVELPDASARRRLGLEGEER